jgi:hypothetical protein
MTELLTVQADNSLHEALLAAERNGTEAIVFALRGIAEEIAVLRQVTEEFANIVGSFPAQQMIEAIER